MSRAAAKAAENQLNITDAAANKFSTQSQQLQAPLEQAYTSDLNSTGMNPTERSSAEDLGYNPINASYDTSQGNMERSAARTGNAASLTPGEIDLSQKRAQDLSTEGNNLTMMNLDEKNRLHSQGEQGLNSLYGTNVQGMESMYGMAPSTINTWNTASQHPLLQGILQAGIGAAGTAAGGFLAKP